jgi:predicted O-methyltransferase YrrM
VGIHHYDFAWLSITRSFLMSGTRRVLIVKVPSSRLTEQSRVAPLQLSLYSEIRSRQEQIIMSPESAEMLISELYEHTLHRKPQQKEFADWVGLLVSGRDPATVVRAFYQSPECQSKNAIKSVFASGHYHSPVVDPRTVKDYWQREMNSPPTDIDLNPEEMLNIWHENLRFIQSTPFTDEREPSNRYSYLGGPFPHGDGITLRLMINKFRPKRIIEIGSGYSSACILDTVEEIGLSDFHLTCIEPDPARLKSLMRAADSSKVTILENLVQDIPADIVDELQAGDFLFVDSTHVMKTGSDVHYEFFHLLPRLQPGVIVHVHDVPYPFEYPNKWVFDENYSWNEAYALRAFLMFNDAFKIFFWPSMLARVYTDNIRQTFPTLLRNPGTSIWIKRVL